MIICITNMFPVVDRRGNDTGRKELLVDYAVDDDTGRVVIVPNLPPAQLGCKWSPEYGEWVLE